MIDLILMFLGTYIEEQPVVPENIEYYEYCYISNQCEVPEYVLPIIEQRIKR